MIFQLKLCRGNSGTCYLLYLQLATTWQHKCSRFFTKHLQKLNLQRLYQHSPSFSDVANVIQACYGESPPPVVLIGHGVGGAIAVHTASNMLVPTTVGLVAIDVVEGKKAPPE